MAKLPSDGESASPPPSKQQMQALVSTTATFLQTLGLDEDIPEDTNKKGAYDKMMVRGLLKVDRIERGRITCVFTVKPSLTNPYNTLHGGVVAALTEAMGLACAGSVAGDKDFFLGELAMSYLSAARVNEEVEVDGCIVRHGRKVIVTSIEFRMKQSRKLVYGGRATFYMMPVANL
ncbi:uncharacterized protein LOC131233840 [Magnolia sinica]|uniref:uncharacterized protein LOC131233840 n=1 Tax=Magnolia sinica TaxID=86752 RepID=UPI00265977F1|nr:uncharacterized protein LOC131233840 [Magnolia sinica]